MDADIVSRLVDAGHTVAMNEDGEVDHFFVDAGYHNGPGCSVCHEGRCEHCDDGRPFKSCPGQAEIDRLEKEGRRAEYEALKAEFDSAATRPASPSDVVGDDMVDRAARYLRETTQAAKSSLVPLKAWDRLPASAKKKWKVLAEGALLAALSAHQDARS